MRRYAEVGEEDDLYQLESCDLFNFLMESVLRKTGVYRNDTIFQNSLQFLAYADYIDIIGRTKRGITAVFSTIEQESGSK